MSKKCKDCPKRPSFANIGEKPKYCATHKFDGMINVTKKRCNNSNCKNKSVSGYIFCVTHGGGVRCDEHDCKSVSVGIKGNNKCKKHGGNPCNEPGCVASARSKSDKCAKHGGGKRCNESGCEYSARSKSDKCITHGGIRCNEYNCESSAIDKSEKCSKHGGGKRCSDPDCGFGAVGKNGKCKKHGGGKRCPNCIGWIDSRCGWNKYDGYCATCFKQIFPHDERSKVIYSHTKEIRVRNAINENFEGFVHDKPLYTTNCDCTHRRRIDHRKLINNTILAVETDEFGHRDYNEKDEEIRYDDLYMIHSGKWIFIRFNPDGDKVDMEDKLEKLVNTIKEKIERIENEENIELLEITKLYY